MPPIDPITLQFHQQPDARWFHTPQPTVRNALLGIGGTAALAAATLGARRQWWTSPQPPSVPNLPPSLRPEFYTPLGRVMYDWAHYDGPIDEVTYLRAALKSIGCQLIDTVNDGDCFYDSIIQSLSRKMGQQFDLSTFRSNVLARMRPYFKDFLDKALKEGDEDVLIEYEEPGKKPAWLHVKTHADVDDYVDKMSLPKAWATDAMLQPAANEISADIVVWKKTRASPHIMYMRTSPLVPVPGAPTFHIVHLGNPPNHYMAIYCPS